jgi:hypothetical protein
MEEFLEAVFSVKSIPGANEKKSWQTAKSLLKQYSLLQNPLRKGVDQRHRLHGSLGPLFYPIDKTNTIAN